MLRRLVTLLTSAFAVLAAGACSGSPSPVAGEGPGAAGEGPRAYFGYGDAARLSYVLTIPERRDEAAPTPLIVFLHSLEERGGPLCALIDNPAGQGKGLAAFALERDDFPFATLSPLCPKGSYWTFLHRRLAALIREVSAERGLSGAPILLCGASMGGIGAWSMGMAYPELFTAVAPMAGAVYTPPIRPRFARLGDIPVWAYHARGDRSIPFDKAYASMAKLLADGGEGELFAVDSDEHYVHERVFAEGLLFERFLALVQARGGSANAP